MNYNFDFIISALIIHLVFLCFFILQNRLPIRKNRIFMCLLLVEAFTILSDIASSWADSLWQQYSVFSLYFLNTMYFVFFIARFMAFFEYSLTVSKAPFLYSKKVKFFLSLPFFISLIITISSFATGAVFAITPETGYVRGPLYDMIYWVSIFYVILALVIITVYRRESLPMERFGIYAFSALLFLGLSLRASFPGTLILDAFVELGVIMIYLTMQNPLFYRSTAADLYNTAAFGEIITEMIRYKKPFSIVAFGIDQYDNNRNIYGIPQMERSLTRIGSWVRTAFSDLEPFYIGHGRFVLFARGNIDPSKIRDVIRERFAREWSTGKDAEIYLNASVSYLQKGQKPDRWETLLNAINVSFSDGLSKTDGMVEIGEEIISRLTRARSVLEAIERGIQQNSFEVYFQPIYSSKTRRIVGAEALARLEDETLGHISPDEFIVLAEQNGMISKLGMQVFEKVCTFMEETHPEDYGTEFINVNLSPVQCMNENLCTEFSAAAEKHGISLSMIDFEITETATADTAFMKEQMDQLIRCGASFSLDDYGMGFTNLARLLALPLSSAKLDKSVVWSYFRKENPIMEDLIRMFVNQDLKIVGEGVETEEMADGLQALGCDYLQGFHFARPMPAEEFMACLLNNSTGAQNA